MVLARSLYMDPTETASPANAAGGNTYTYYNLNDDQIASVSPMGNPSTCNPLSVSTCVYTTYAAFDAMGNAVSGTSETSASGTQGPTTTSYFDPDGTQIALVSPEGNVSGSAANYEQASVPNNLGSTVSQTPASNLASASCSVVSDSPCPNTVVFGYDSASEQVSSATAAGGEGGSTTPIMSTSTYNPTSTNSDATQISSSGSSLQESNAFDSDGSELSSTVSAPATTNSGSTATYEPDGATCWSSPLPWTGGSAPSCDSPPTGSGTQTTVNYYDASGNLVAVSGPGSNPYATGNSGGCNPLTTSACADTTYYTYDEDNHQLTATQPSDYTGSAYPLTTNYYDASGNLVAVTGPAGSPGSCNPITTSTCTDTTYKTYDGAGRVTQISYTDGTPTVTYSYNNDGTRHQMVDGTGTTTYTYDDLGQLTKKVDGAGNTVSYGYDSAGELTCMSYPNTSSDTCSTSGAGTTTPPSGDITYTYDDFGRLSSIVTWATYSGGGNVTLTYAYDCADNLYWVSTGTTSGTPCTGSTPAPLAPPTATSAITTVYGYTNGQQTSIATSTNNTSTPLLGFTLGYNGDNLLSSSTPKTNTTTLATDSSSYDGANRVATGPITGSSGSDTYAYTPANSITADTTAFQSAAYASTGSSAGRSRGPRRTPAGPRRPAHQYTYDASGDRLSVTPSSGNDESLGWEQASERLVCVNTNGTTCSTSSPTSTTMVYSYNGDGERATSKLGSGSTTTFVWDGRSDRTDVSANQDFIYGLNPSAPVLQITLDCSTPAVDLLCQDQNGSVRGIVQIDGGPARRSPRDGAHGASQRAAYASARRCLRPALLARRAAPVSPHS